MNDINTLPEKRDDSDKDKDDEDNFEEGGEEE
jgi:hypothetical protein